jgi:glycosyltransferase involved in cell wall biosynthesis
VDRSTARQRPADRRRRSPQQTAPAVSVLIPVLNEARYLDRTVPAMLGQDFEGGLEFIFIDGGSTDGSRALIETWAEHDDRVVLLDNPQRWTPQALNIGLRRARGTYIARMDAHTMYPADYLARGVARLARGDVVSVSGPQVAVGTGGWSDRIALALNTRLGTGGASFRRVAAGEHDVPTGFTGVWRRDLLLAKGGWDEDWLNDQDSELSARLRVDGGRIICVPEMAADYIPRDSLSRLARQYWRYGVYRVKTTHRHPWTLRRSQLLPPALVVTAAAAVLPAPPIRRWARVGLASYAAALGVTTTVSARSGAGRDALALPAVYSVMHFSYGAGFVAAAARSGFPVRGVAAALTGARRGGHG